MYRFVCDPNAVHNITYKEVKVLCHFFTQKKQIWSSEIVTQSRILTGTDHTPSRIHTLDGERDKKGVPGTEDTLTLKSHAPSSKYR